MWMYDLAREQNADPYFMRRLCQTTLDGGYNALGLYLEHRFAYPSTPWSHGQGVLTPELVRELQAEFPTLQLIPFINLLGHFEGMIYTEEGSQYACERFKGMQADPTNSDFIELCQQIIKDTVEIFNSPIIHIGGDETNQLGLGAGSAERIKELEAEGFEDPKAELYGSHFGPLALSVLEYGRTPAVWGDMFFEHPTALSHLPKETLIFDWQYFKSPEHTSKLFRDQGYSVVFSPAIHTYNAVWCHLAQSELNVAEHAEAAVRLGAYGVCVTTWECGLFGNYETLLPAIRGAGKILCDAEPDKDRGAPLENGTRDEDIEIYRRKAKHAPRFLKEYLKESEPYEDWARLMGIEMQYSGGLFEFGGLRSPVKARLLLFSNPFLLWLHHREDLAGQPGKLALATVEESFNFATDPNTRSVSLFAKKALEFVPFVEKAHEAYKKGNPAEAINKLAPARQIFEDIERSAVANNINCGGSQADIFRAKAAKRHVEEVILRLKSYGDGSLGYLPSFETLTHPKFMPHDQANWWLINKWANE